MDKTTKIEADGLSELWQVNKNISAYRKLLKVEMLEERKKEIREEISYLETEVIPQLKFHDV
jgi:hypothetical protein